MQESPPYRLGMSFPTRRRRAGVVHPRRDERPAGDDRSSGEHLRSTGSALRRAIRAAGAGVRGGRLPAGGRSVARPHQPVADRDYGSRPSIRELSVTGPALPADRFADRVTSLTCYTAFVIIRGQGGPWVNPQFFSSQRFPARSTSKYTNDYYAPPQAP